MKINKKYNIMIQDSVKLRTIAKIFDKYSKNTNNRNIVYDLYEIADRIDNKNLYTINKSLLFISLLIGFFIGLLF